MEGCTLCTWFIRRQLHLENIDIYAVETAGEHKLVNKNMNQLKKYKLICHLQLLKM
jgi:hypothetical protein